MTERSLSLDYLTTVLPHIAYGFAMRFFSGFFRFRPPTDWPVSYEMNNLESYVKLNLKKKSVPYYSNYPSLLHLPLFAIIQEYRQ